MDDAAQKLREVEELRKEADEITQSVSAKTGQIALLRERFAEQQKELKKFGAKSPEHLKELLADAMKRLASNTDRLKKMVQLYKAGNYKAILESDEPEKG